MPNMIDSLGVDWFTKKFRDAMFVHNGRVYRVVGIVDHENVYTKDLTTGDNVNIPYDVFTGFSKFQYPLLGYRRIADNAVVWCTKIHSALRGLRTEKVNTTYTPTTERLIMDGVIRPRNDQLPIQVMAPSFDTKDKIKDLLENKTANVVLNASVLIEPDLTVDIDQYVVFHRLNRAATLAPDGTYTYLTKQYSKLLTPILGNGVDHANR